MSDADSGAVRAAIRDALRGSVLVALFVSAHACTSEPDAGASPALSSGDSPSSAVPPTPESSSPPGDGTATSAPVGTESGPSTAGSHAASGGAPAAPPEAMPSARGGGAGASSEPPSGGGSGAAPIAGSGGSAAGPVGGASGSGGAAAGNGGTAGVEASAGADAGSAGPSRPARVLLYSFSTLDIPSVPAQLAILRQALEGWQYEVEESVDPAVFTDDGLARFAAVGMINTCFYPFGQNQSGEAESLALQRFLQEGGGLFGTHCADVTFQSANPPALYNELIGGRASSQNFEGESRCRKLEEHPTTANLPETFSYTGNLDGTDFIAADSTVLVSCAWNAGAGMEVAVSWVRNEGNGRVFFSNFGKVDADLTNATIGDPHLLAGLGWILGR